MEIVISHQSALHFWRIFRGNVRRFERCACSEAMIKPVRLDAELCGELGSIGFEVSKKKPLDLLFYKGGTKSESQQIRSHTTSRALPAGSLVRLSDNVLIASPELVFAQVAGEHPFGQFIMAGCELCGRYRVLGDDGTRLPLPEERLQLTCAENITDMLRQLGLGPRTKAARAARYLFDNARSPMEAKVALLLSMPPRLGGFGLPRPVLNPDYHLGPEALVLYPCETCHPDLYWPEARFDVEYDGSDTHTAEAHARDVARAVAFAREGLEVLTVTKAQVYSRRAFDEVAGIVARRLHRRLPDATPQFERAHTCLRRELNLG